MEAHKRGLTLMFDPSGDRNRCFYECLGKHLMLSADEVIAMVLSFMSANQFVSMKSKVGI